MKFIRKPEKNNCPICDGKLEVYKFEKRLIRAICIRCASVECRYGNSFTKVRIFGEDFLFHKKYYRKKAMVELENTINYYKENDRYLMEILTKE